MLSDYFWAKKGYSGGSARWLSLPQHLLDTKGVIGLLWEHWVSPAQKRLVSESLPSWNEEKVKSFIEFLGMVHDLGKATPAFQIQPSYPTASELDFDLLERLDQQGFQGISSLFLINRKNTPHGLAGEVLLVEYGLNWGIASLVGAHHGMPPLTENAVETQLEAYTANYFQSEDVHSKVHQQWKNSQNELFHWILRETGCTSSEEFPSLPKAVLLVLSGLIIMADWLASNSDYFPLLEFNQTYASDQQNRLLTAWAAWNPSELWEVSNTYRNEELSQLFEDRFGFQPRSMQKSALDAIGKMESPGLIILEASMGSGKTEFSLFATEMLAARFGQRGLFLGLPTQATSNGIFPRVRDWLFQSIPDEMNHQSLRLVHGKAALNPTFQALAQGVNEDGEPNGAISVNAWFSGNKRASLDDFVVGTVDQVLMMALQQKHLALRHLGLSKKVVIVDEVHAYDAYMSSYLEKALAWLAAFQVPVILLSATLPKEKRISFVQAYLSGSGFSKKEIQGLPALQESNVYPALTITQKNKAFRVALPQTLEEKRIQVEPLEEKELYQTVETAVEAGCSVGLILNTVRRAQSIASEFKVRLPENKIRLLHSSMIATHRQQVESEIIDMIGKDAKNRSACLIIGTQVLEQSLDIDFDVLITDLAPMDLLLQRIGRLHRHNRLRPKGFETPRTYILGMQPDYTYESGTLSIYGGQLLMRTQMLLQKEISIPSDIPKLVEAVYDLENHLNWTEEQEAVYQKFTEQEKSKREMKSQRAKVFQLDKPRKRVRSIHGDSLIGLLNFTQPNLSDERAKAQVRDTEETIEVIAVKKCGDGYSLMNKEEDLSQLIGNTSTAKTIALQTMPLPGQLSKLYNVEETISTLEKYNLKYLRNWQSSPWLKGQLGIIFDEAGRFSLNGNTLVYDAFTGLQIERKSEDEPI